MTKLVLPIVLVTACVAPEYPDAPTNPTTPVEIAPTAATDSEFVIATGGTLGFAIDDVTSIGLSGTASNGYQVEPHARVWPNTTQPLYYVRALAAGSGWFEIATNRGIASGLVESADVAEVAIVPAGYELDGRSAFALDLNRRDVEVAVRDRDGRRLVDATLGILDGQSAWDRATVAAAIGPQAVRVYADSFAERALAIDVVDGIDRIEAIATGDRTCFHAYAGSTEVATAMTLTGGTAIPGVTNCAIGAPGSIAAVRQARAF